MGLKVSQLTETVRTVKFQFLSQPVKVKYRLSAINSEYGSWLEEHGNERGSLMDAIERVVLEWDVEGPDGDALPVKREFMEGWPTPFLNAVMNAVLEDATPAKLAIAKSA